MERSTGKDLYYTADHEWINYEGTVAYMGVCSFKLTGFREIHAITFHQPSGFLKQGELIASIRYNEYTIGVHMPADGKIVRINEALLSGNRDVLIKHPESSGWVAMVIPSQPYERKGLLLPKQYQLKRKTFHVQ